MKFYPMHDLKTKSRNLWADISRREEVVFTNNGKPTAIMIDIPEGKSDEVIQALRQAKAMTALRNMRERASREGFKSDDEIEHLINEARNAE